MANVFPQYNNQLPFYSPLEKQISETIFELYSCYKISTPVFSVIEVCNESLLNVKLCHSFTRRIGRFYFECTSLRSICSAGVSSFSLLMSFNFSRAPNITIAFPAPPPPQKQC